MPCCGDQFATINIVCNRCITDMAGALAFGYPPLSSCMKSFEELRDGFAKARAYGDIDKLQEIYQGLLLHDTEVAHLKALHVKGNIDLRTGNLDEAKAALTEVLAAYNHLGNLDVTSNVYNDLGHVGQLMNDHEKALGYIQQALEQHRKLNDAINVGNDKGIMAYT